MFGLKLEGNREKLVQTVDPCLLFVHYDFWISVGFSNLFSVLNCNLAMVPYRNVVVASTIKLPFEETTPLIDFGFRLNNNRLKVDNKGVVSVSHKRSVGSNATFIISACV